MVINIKANYWKINIMAKVYLQITIQIQHNKDNLKMVN